MAKNKSKFYEFDQNNSGGNFHRTTKLSHQVIIEALSVDDANTRAESIGIYFDGVDDGYDCDCCGDRWYETSGSIILLGDTIEEHLQAIKPRKIEMAENFGEGNPYIIIHKLNGTILYSDF